MEYFSTFGIILLSLAYIVSSKLVKESPTSQIHDVVEGQNLTVVCNTNRTDDPDVFWRKNNTIFFANGYQNGSEYNFIDIRRSATGTYVCLVQNETSPDHLIPVDEVKINVLYPAEIVSFNVTPTVLVENNVFDVFCDVTGNPTPEFVIINSRTGHVYVDFQASVSVTDHILATCEDQATWICTGRNHLNKGNVTRSANVTVFCAPRPDLSKMKSWSKVEAVVGNSRPLAIFNYGYPYPKYTWNHNGKFFSNGSHKDYGYASTLQIDNIQVEDFGRYHIDMVNEYGHSRSEIELVPNGPPEKPYNLEITDITHDSAKLRWTSGYDMGSPQYFLVLRYDGYTAGYYTYHPYVYDNSANHGVGAEHEFLATGMWSDTLYGFAIVAQNSYEDTFGFPVSVYSDKVMLRTKVAQPTITMTPHTSYSSLLPSLGVIAGVSAGAGLLLIVVIASLIIVCQRTKKAPDSVLREKKVHTIENKNNLPLQLGISAEMKK